MNSVKKGGQNGPEPHLIWTGPRLSDIEDCEAKLFSGSITLYGNNNLPTSTTGSDPGIPVIESEVERILQAGPGCEPFNLCYLESGFCGEGATRIRFNHNDPDTLQDLFILVTQLAILHQVRRHNSENGRNDTVWFMAYNPNYIDYHLNLDYMKVDFPEYLQALNSGTETERQRKLNEYIGNYLWTEGGNNLERARNFIRKTVGELIDYEVSFGNASKDMQETGEAKLIAYAVSNKIRRHTLCVNPDNEMMSRVDNKKEFRKLCRNIGVPTTETIAVSSGEKSFTYPMLRKYIPSGTIVLQQIHSSGGNGTHIIEEPKTDKDRKDEKVLKEIDDRIRDIMGSGGEFVLSRYRDPNIPVNIHAFICDDAVSVTNASVQIIDDSSKRLIYSGADYIAFKEVARDRPELVDQMYTYIEWVCKALQGEGYRGIIGFDVILSDRVEFVEANNRFQASTSLLNRALAESGIRHGGAEDSTFIDRKYTRYGVPSERRSPSTQLLNLLAFYDVDMDTDDVVRARNLNVIIKQLYRRCYPERTAKIPDEEYYKKEYTLKFPISSEEFHALEIPFSTYIYYAPKILHSNVPVPKNPDFPTVEEVLGDDFRHIRHTLMAHEARLEKNREMMVKTMGNMDLDTIIKLLNNIMDIKNNPEEEIRAEVQLRGFHRHLFLITRLFEYLPESTNVSNDEPYKAMEDYLNGIRAALKKCFENKIQADNPSIPVILKNCMGLCRESNEEFLCRSPIPISNLDYTDVNRFTERTRTDFGTFADNAYLFKIVFRRNIVSTLCDKTYIHPNLMSPSQEWLGTILRTENESRFDELLPLKISLLNNGARIPVKYLDESFRLSDPMKGREDAKDDSAREKTLIRNYRYWGANRFEEYTTLSLDAEIICDKFEYTGKTRNSLPVKIAVNNFISDYSPFTLVKIENELKVAYYDCPIKTIRKLDYNYIDESKEINSVPLTAMVSQEPGNLCFRQSGICRFMKFDKGCKFCKYSMKKLNRENSYVFEAKELEKAISPDNLLKPFEDAVKNKSIRVSIGGGTKGGHEGERKKHIADLCSYVGKAFEAPPIHLKCVPPSTHPDLEEYRKAGVDTISMNVEIFDRKRASSIMPGKTEMSISSYINTLRYAVNVWPMPGSVMSGMIIGLEPRQSLIEGIRMLCSIGVSPVLSIFHPIDRTELEHTMPPNSEEVHQIFQETMEICDVCSVPLGPKEFMSQYDKVVLPDDRKLSTTYLQGLKMRQIFNGGA